MPELLPKFYCTIIELGFRKKEEIELNITLEYFEKNSLGIPGKLLYKKGGIL